MPSSSLALGNTLLQRVANPFFGVIGTGQLAAATTTRGQLLLPYPQYTRVINYRPNAASSSYHSLQLQAQKRYSYGIQFLVAYTVAKSIDDSSDLNSGAHQDFYNRRADRSISLQDISQRLIASYVIDLPFGRGRRLGGNLSGPANVLLGGWQLNGIMTLQSGLPSCCQPTPTTAILFRPPSART